MDKQAFDTTLKTVLLDICQKLGIEYDNEMLTHLEERIEFFNHDVYLAYVAFVKALSEYMELEKRNPGSKELVLSQQELDNSKKRLEWTVKEYEIRVNWTRVQKIQGIISRMVENDPDNNHGPNWSQWTLGYSEKNELPLNMEKGMYWPIRAGELIPIIQHFRRKRIAIDEGRPPKDLNKANFIFVFRRA